MYGDLTCQPIIIYGMDCKQSKHIIIFEVFPVWFFLLLVLWNSTLHCSVLERSNGLSDFLDYSIKRTLFTVNYPISKQKFPKIIFLVIVAHLLYNCQIEPLVDIHELPYVSLGGWHQTGSGRDEGFVRAEPRRRVSNVQYIQCCVHRMPYSRALLLISKFHTDMNNVHR